MKTCIAGTICLYALAGALAVGVSAREKPPVAAPTLASLVELAAGARVFLRDGTRVVLSDAGVEIGAGEAWVEVPALEEGLFSVRAGGAVVSAEKAGFDVRLDAGDRQVVLGYSEVLPRIRGVTRYVYPMGDGDPVRVQEFSLSADVVAGDAQVRTIGGARLEAGPKGTRRVTMRRSGFSPRGDPPAGPGLRNADPAPAAGRPARREG